MPKNKDVKDKDMLSGCLAGIVLAAARAPRPRDMRLRLRCLELDPAVNLDREDEPLRELDKAEQLAAVVLHVLVEERLREFEQIARSVERDPGKPDERTEVKEALRLLEVYELAVRAEGGGWLATLPAHMATVLSF